MRLTCDDAAYGFRKAMEAEAGPGQQSTTGQGELRGGARIRRPALGTTRRPNRGSFAFRAGSVDVKGERLWVPRSQDVTHRLRCRAARVMENYSTSVD